LIIFEDFINGETTFQFYQYIHTKSIFLQKKTPSTSTISKQAYYFSVKDIIFQVLNNPTFPNVFWREGKIVENKSEYWHGEIWAESQKSLPIQQDTYLHIDK
jgi:hypothetical protein